MIEPVTFLHTPSPDYVMRQSRAHMHWVRESKANGWGSGTIWPPEALDIMNGGDGNV